MVIPITYKIWITILNFMYISSDAIEGAYVEEQHGLWNDT